MRHHWCTALFFVLAGCSVGPREAPSPLPAGSPSAASAGSTGAPRGPSPRASDPRWRRALADDDPAERERLATAVGAVGLLEGLDDGGAIALVALSTLPYADDADIALGRLADMAQGPSAPLRRPVLEAILSIAGRPQRSRELLDPEGVRRAAEAMIAIAARPEIAREERALAISAARALAEKGYMDPRRIPGDLDPR